MLEGVSNFQANYTIMEILFMQVRMDAYRQAILNNPSLMKGATVLDVGCGTGILRWDSFLVSGCIVNFFLCHMPIN